MDVIQIEKTKENFRLLYDTKGKFTLHRIVKDEATYKLCKVRKITRGPKGTPYCQRHRACGPCRRQDLGPYKILNTEQTLNT